MKLVTAFTFVLLTFSALPAMALRAFFDYRVFQHPTDGPYVECITSFDGATFELAPQDSGKYMSRAELVIIVSQQGEIVAHRKLNINGPLVNSNQPEDFIALERFLLPNGKYDVELEVTDLVRGGNAETLYQTMEIQNPSSGIFVSDIAFISAYRKTTAINAFSKAGYDMIPYVSGYFNSQAKQLSFYAEIYNTAKELGAKEPFVYAISIWDEHNKEWEEGKKWKRESATEVVPMLQTIDIAGLPSGQYTLRIEIRNRNNEVVSTQNRRFNRVSIPPMPEQEVVVSDAAVAGSFAAQYTNRDELYALILAHMPIAEGLDRTTITYQLKNADVPMLQSFLYSFWLKQNRENPEAAFRNYEKQIKEVDAAFGNGKKPGWQTDRGRVYLQYGPPNVRAIRNNEAEYFPFEIWHYYETNTKLHNKRFLFYSTDLTTDMELLHSDVPNEVKNYQWREMVRSRPTALNMSEGSTINSQQKTDPFSRDELENLWYTPH